MGSTVEIAGQTFADPFDLFQAAPAGSKLSLEADAIILALEQILAALKELDREPVQSLDEDEGLDWTYLANNILQLATMLGNVKWGEAGGIEQVRLTLEAQLKMLRRMLADLIKTAGSDPRKQDMIRYLQGVLGIGKKALDDAKRLSDAARKAVNDARRN